MIEKKIIEKYPVRVIAVDEVGRGPLCGPVMVGGIAVTVKSQDDLVTLLKSLKKFNITDSKKLKQNERKQILSELGLTDLKLREEKSIKIGSQKIDIVVWDLSAQVIDEENILSASLRGMREAALSLSDVKKKKHTLLIDGPYKLRWGNETSPFDEFPIIKGDSRSLLIGLASIIAKVVRDDFMERLHDEIPEFDLKKNYGYPTKKHREALQKYGPSVWHRKTFKGVKEYFEGAEK